MALSDSRKAREAIWCVCDLTDFRDEEHLILPYTREAARSVYDDSQTMEWKDNAISREYDRNLFDPNFLKRVWLGWRGIPDPQQPGQRLKGPGIVHADGTVEWPAAFTEDNKFELLNIRPTDFYTWLQN